MRKYIPKNIKKNIHIFHRKWTDFIHKRKYAREISQQLIGTVQRELEIEIKKGSFFENKIHNLKIVENKLNGLILKPNEYFSFWEVVGEATHKNGFKEGRNLINNKISSDFGGGICQYSSILYYAFLNSDLKLIERHHHSIDIYEDHERYLPLGGDSTVSFGFKDLQFLNNLNFPVQIKTKVNNENISLQIISEHSMNFKKLHFEYENIENAINVTTFLDNKVYFSNLYKKK